MESETNSVALLLAEGPHSPLLIDDNDRRQHCFHHLTVLSPNGQGVLAILEQQAVVDDEQFLQTPIEPGVGLFCSEPTCGFDRSGRKMSGTIGIQSKR